MITKNTIRHLNQLQEKKYRREFGEFTVEGVKGVKEALLSETEVLLVVIDGKLREGADMMEIIKLAEVNEADVEFCGRKDIGDIKSTDTFPGVIAIVQKPEFGSNELLNDSPIIALDGVKDPGNLGTIIRTADWFGIKNIILSEDTVDPYNPKVVRSTMGSMFRIKIFESTNFVHTLTQLKTKNKYTIVSLDMNGKTLDKLKPEKNIIYVFGSESHGVSPKLDNLITERYTIQGKGKAESLNVAVVTGIAMFQISK